MADTIFFQGKLKRGKKPLEVFEKIVKGIKKKGPTKNWTYQIENDEVLDIDFNDEEESENFVLSFNDKGEFYTSCKVYFPLEGELFEDGKSEFKALLDLLYKAKSMFHSIEITDDYALAEAYWDSKKFKLVLRELTSEEDERIRRLYFEGYTTHEEILWAVMAEDMKMSVEDLKNYANPDISQVSMVDYARIIMHLETYLYETAEFQKEGRLCDIPEEIYYDLGKVQFSVFAFVIGLSWVFFDGSGPDKTINLEKGNSVSQKDAQVELFFRERFAPLFMEEKDSLEKCILVYRYFLSVYDYLGFHYVGRMENKERVIDRVLKEYGEEKGKILLTYYCTLCKYYIYDKYTAKEEKTKRRNRIFENMQKRHGDDILGDCLDFHEKYSANRELKKEIFFIMRTNWKYIDKSLIV